MKHDTRAYLHDAIAAGENIQRFVQGVTFKKYCSDIFTRSAVERQFEIIGEALMRISRYDPELASRISIIRDIIDFRNIIAHGYDVVDNTIVWDIINNHLPDFMDTCRDLLETL